MIVGPVAERATDGARRVEARIAWEDAPRAEQTLYYEVGPDHAAPLTADPNAFLVGAVLPAWHAGERRVRVEGPLCPMLLDQLRAPLLTLASWYPELGPPPAVEWAGHEAPPPTGDRALSLLSCGIDSLATLRANRLWFDPDHPLAIRSCLLVDFVDERAERSNPDAAKIDAARRVCDDVGADVVLMRTNIWSLDGDGWFFAKSAFGAMFLSAAHVLSGAYRHAYIAASIDAQHPSVPAGSSPLLDPYYSSARLQVHHHGTYMPRLERTALVAGWPVGLDNIRVCVHDVRGSGNCGTCEKCIRTKLMLVALGKLRESAAFAERDIDRDLLQTVIEYRMIWVGNLRDAYADLVPLLERRARYDLVAGVHAILADFDARAAAGDPDIIPG
ncbi:hypothetical protein [Miltoncostaea marina]|uniref:hypothetical protein n=1 Tax=Miltoncostaea marina TaxID=2843215 RepID=UPI001C3E27EE|nr:hypothetical protein [Miltoncostaea marina]